MKCPYRTITETTDGVSKTEFCECYRSSCPWYCSAITKNDETISEETCQRCHTEYIKAQAFYANQKRFDKQ